MTASDRAAYAILADAFAYPDPGRLALMRRGRDAAPPGPVKDGYAGFIRQIERLSLGEWEELHTRTLDLSPAVAPYVGYQMWGDSYQRGAFMSNLNRALIDTGVDPTGELPDHLTPILRYLAAVDDPLPELVEVLGPALERMASALRGAEPNNPYVSLLGATQALCQGLNKKKEEA